MFLLLTSLFSVLSLSSAFSCRSFCSPELPVVIVGGGLSGVAAAQALSKANCSFQIVEARSFLGGRLQTHYSDEGDLLHFGANWIHGTGLNPLWVLNQDKRLVRTQWLPKSYYVKSRSGVQTFVGNSSYVPGSDLRDDFASFYLQHAHVKSYIASVANGSYSRPDFPSTWFTQEYVSSKNLTSQQIDDLYLFQMAYQTMDEAIEPSMVGFSALLNNKFYGTDNEGFDQFAFVVHLTCSLIDSFLFSEMVAEPGYMAFIDYLAQSIPSDAVHLNSVVNKIAYDENGVYVTATKDGQPNMYSGAAAIITVPLGVLQFEDIEFSTPLPPWKRIAIDRTHMGLLVLNWISTILFEHLH
jgi:polyamine oxidase